MIFNRFRTGTSSELVHHCWLPVMKMVGSLLASQNTLLCGYIAPQRYLALSHGDKGSMPRTIRNVEIVKTPAASQQAPLAPQALLEAYVLTVSDSCSRGERKDLSGPAVDALLREAGFTVNGQAVVADEIGRIGDALREAARPGHLLVTTGGTGLTTRDVPPEATRAVCSRLLDGLSEQMRTEGLKETPFAVLSRGVCGLLATPGGEALVINLPGAPQGAVTSLKALLPVLPHALELLRNARAPHPVEAAPAPILEQSS